MEQQEGRRVVAKKADNDMGWEAEVDGQVWRWASWETMMKDVSRMVGECVVEAQVASVKVEDWTRSGE